MPQPYAYTQSIQLATGTLTFRTADPELLHELCDFAARANPKRGFLIVSKVLGRHLPARPAAMRKTMAELAAKIDPNLPGPVVFFGLAETATGLGQGVFEAWQAATGRADALYLQSTRCDLPGTSNSEGTDSAALVATFEEGHSHASTHLVHIGGPDIARQAYKARTLVIVDDECSTGNTFIAAATALRKLMPNIGQIKAISITDWSDHTWLRKMPCTAESINLLRGALEWAPDPGAPTLLLPARANSRGNAPETGMRARTGIITPERPLFPWGHDPLPLLDEIQPGERIVVLGDGEHAYAALQIAEAIEAAGGIAAVQAITRSPVLPGHAIRTTSQFADSSGSGAMCFAYNLTLHNPSRVVIACERADQQIRDLAAALIDLGHSAQMIAIDCAYTDTPDTRTHAYVAKIT